MRLPLAPGLAAVLVGLPAALAVAAPPPSAPDPSAVLRTWKQACLTLPAPQLGEAASRAQAALLDESAMASGDDAACYARVLAADGLLLRELRQRASSRSDGAELAREYHDAAEALSRHLRTNPNQYVVDFSDRSRRVEIDPYPALDVQRAFTYALWVYLQAPALVPHTKVFSHAGVDPGKVTLLLNDNHPVALARLADGSEARFVDSSPLPVGRWIHIGLTFHELAGCALYLDGAARPLRATPPWRAGSRVQAKPDQTLYLGCLDRCFPGHIDEVRVYDRALTASEIARLSRGEDVRDGMVGHWPLDEVMAGLTPNCVSGGRPGRVGERVQLDRPAAPALRGGHSLGFSGKREAWATRLAELQLRVDAAEVAMLRAAAASGPVPDVRSPAIHLETVLERLRRGSARLIHYVELPASSQWVAFLLDPTADRAVRRFDLGSREPIQAAIERLQQALALPAGDTGFVAPDALAAAELREATRQLSRWIWDPLAPALGGGGEVWLRLTPALERVPFAALVAPDGRQLVEDFAFAAVGPVLEAGTRAGRGVESPARPAVLFANPAFNHYPAQREQAWKEPTAPRAAGRQRGEPQPASSARPAKSQGGEPCDCVLLGAYLQGSAEELRTIASLLREDGRREVRTFEWGDAYESSLKQVAPAAGLLHLATHAYRLDATCLPATPLSAWEMVGIRLSGANRLLPDDTEQPDDGFLSAAEFARLDLRRCELVVLSGCSTAQAAADVAGDAMGLAAAAWVAGAGASLVTLWDIPDAETPPSMARFHAALLAGASPAQALRASQLEARGGARGTTAPPRVWASFALRGW